MKRQHHTSICALSLSVLFTTLYTPSEAGAQTVESVDFTSGIPEGWVSECSNIDRSAESCDIQEINGAVRLSAVASCLTSPYNGARSHLTSNFDLPAGQYELRGTSSLRAEHTFYCSGSGGGRIGVSVGLQNRGFERCMAPNCTTCSLQQTESTGCVSHEGGEVVLGVYMAAGDCSEGYGDVTGFEVVDITAPIVPVWPQDVEVVCGGSTDPMDTGVATGTNACSEVPATYEDAITASCPPLLIRTWTLDDGANTATHMQTIALTDDEAPILAGEATDACIVGNDGEYCVSAFAAQIGATDCDTNAALVGATCTVSDGDGDPAVALDCTYDADQNTLCFDTTLTDGVELSRVEVTATFADSCGNLSGLLAHTFSVGLGDADGDGLGNPCDPNDDDDVLADADDNCPLVANDDQADLDSDDIGDACDDDDDGDMVPDVDDNCPLTENPDQADNDFDNLGDACDDDDDNDSVLDADDNCPLIENTDQANTDTDDLGDACDDDDDGDSVLDADDNCPLVANADQADTDTDDLGDACDDDDDGDTILDADDNCPLIENTDQINTDTDDLGDACDDDDDDDTVLDADDNCPLVANDDQTDADSDALGDACDDTPEPPVDGDGDTVPDVDDNCPAAANTDQADTDGDGVGDACDACPETSEATCDDIFDGENNDVDEENNAIDEDNGEDSTGTSGGQGSSDSCSTATPAAVPTSPLAALLALCAGALLLRRRR